MTQRPRDVSTAREEVLQRVRAALRTDCGVGELVSGRPAKSSPAAPAIPEPVVRQVPHSSPKELWGILAQRLADLGDTAILVRSPEQAWTAIADIVRQYSLKLGGIDRDAAEWIGGTAASTHTLGPAALELAEHRDRLFEFDFGVTLCDIAVAETGTLVLAATSSRSRLTSLAPPNHICLLPLSRLVPDLLDAQERVGVQIAQNQVWITGSSRTADIEGIIIRGVHGPARVFAIGIEDS